MILKKNYRFLLTFGKYIFIKLFNKVFFFRNIKIIPSLEELNFLKINYSTKTRRFLFKNRKKIIGKIILDTSLIDTELCLLGEKYQTNKSSLNLNGHRSGYSAFYSLIFANLKEKKINFAEIGIEKNASTKMWREYFSKARLNLFEYDKLKIQIAKKDKLKNSFYYHTDVSSSKKIKESLSKVKAKFDIIIDDSTHVFDHQINIVKNSLNFLNPNGLLIIEDISKKFSEERYEISLKHILKKFKKAMFVETYHANNFTSKYFMTKLLFFIK
jgi:hypothetical protein